MKSLNITKRVLTIILSIGLTMGLLTGCGTKVATDNEALVKEEIEETTVATEADTEETEKATEEPVFEDDGIVDVVCTIFPAYDWVKQIAGPDNDKVNVTLLMKDGTDLHNYQPTPEDIVTISKCDLFIYVGGESDTWVNDVLATAENKQMIVVNLLDTLGKTVKPEETVEGMQTDINEASEITTDPELDEHIWLSLKNAKKLCAYLCMQLQILDTPNNTKYTKSTNEYLTQLSDLDAEYQEMVDSATTKTVVFCDRFPFRYLVDDYGLEYFAAFTGCSAESEASFETIMFLAQKLDNLGLSHVFTIEGQDASIALTVVKNTKTKDQEILTVNSMQSITEKEISNGATYLSIMDENLDVFSQGIN